MSYFAVEVERTERQTVLIEADTEEEARQGAVFLADGRGGEWDEVDQDAWSRVLSERPDEPYWSGGAEGEWVMP